MTQIRSNKVLNSLKVAHEIFTFNGSKYHIVGRYGGHKWHGFWAQVLDAREAFPLSTEFRLARLCKQTRISTSTPSFRSEERRVGKECRL